jgi:hypothetical protein
MLTIHELKEQEVIETPLLLFDCELADGTIQRWSTHRVTFEGNTYEARVLKHNVFEFKSWTNDGVDAISKISLTLANVDSGVSEIERSTGWKGSKLTVRFVFFDVQAGQPVSASRTLFLGAANRPEEIAESTARLSFTNRLNLQRLLLPEVRIQRRCPWAFPSTTEQCNEALIGGTRGKFSPFEPCGYSADLTGGAGNLNCNAPYTTCDYTRSQCQLRGMFDTDSHGTLTRRFGGIEFVPSSIEVRSYGEKGTHVSSTVENGTLYNDFVPLVYGTAWYKPPIVFARNDGNLTHMEVLLGMGEMQGVLKVLVDDIEIPQGVSGTDMTATGWYNVVTNGARSGSFNLDFLDSAGQPAGDPYGSMAMMSLVVPNSISEGSTLPSVKVLAEGMKLRRYDTTGNYLDESFNNNPAWVLLDLLMWTGWNPDEIDLASFATTAAYCDTPISSEDLNGNAILIPRFQCNLILRKRRSAADVLRGVRSGAGVLLTFARRARSPV